MITVKTAMTFDRVREAREAPQPTDEVSDEERSALEYLDAAVESGVFKSFRGEPFEFPIPAEFTTPAVVAALKRRYESGGWSVGLFCIFEDQMRQSGNVVGYQLVFSPGGAPESSSLAEVPPPTVVTTLRSAVRAARRRTRPSVCLVSDVPGWAFDQNMRDMAAHLGDDFDFHFFYTEDWFKGARPDWGEYDIVYETYHRNPQMGVPMSRALGALRSEWFFPERPRTPGEEEFGVVNAYRGFQVAVRRNLDEYLPNCPRVVYLTNPVNAQRFGDERSRFDSIVAEWNGNAQHKSPDGRYIKHYYDIVVPACLRSKTKWVAAEFSTKEGQYRRRASSEMSEFYRQANVALCASEYEAASNSVMEAMAAGLALVATDVGNHRELRDSQLAAYGDTGIVLVERAVDAFADALSQLTPERAREMGEINRREIADRWSWDAWRDRYRDFIRMAL